MMQQTNGFAKENEATGVKQPLTAIFAGSDGWGWWGEGKMADVRLWLCGNAVRMLEFARPFVMAFRREIFAHPPLGAQ